MILHPARMISISSTEKQSIFLPLSTPFIRTLAELSIIVFNGTRNTGKVRFIISVMASSSCIVFVSCLRLDIISFRLRFWIISKEAIIINTTFIFMPVGGKRDNTISVTIVIITLTPRELDYGRRSEFRHIYSRNQDDHGKSRARRLTLAQSHEL